MSQISFFFRCTGLMLFTDSEAQREAEMGKWLLKSSPEVPPSGGHRKDRGARRARLPETVAGAQSW